MIEMIKREMGEPITKGFTQTEKEKREKSVLIIFSH